MDPKTEDGESMFAIEVTFDRNPSGDRNFCRHEAEPEIAAQVFESEAEPRKCELAALVEALASGERLESFNEETAKRVVAFELVEAVV